jgi:hypothetical protein
MVELEKRLRTSGVGRPTDRRLLVAAFGRQLLENGRPEILANVKDFQTASEPLHWAYDHPAREGSNRDQSNVYRTLHTALGRTDPDMCLALNVRAFVRIRDLIGDPDIGRYLLIDGTSTPAPREQRAAGASRPAEEPFLRRGLDGATYTTHGPRKYWRGYSLIYITDVKTGLPLGFAVQPGNRPEWECIRPLLMNIHQHWADCAGEPWEPAYLVGDAHFDNEQVHRLLEEQFGIHPVFPHAVLPGSAFAHADNLGTPRCSKHGDMKLHQSQYFMDSTQRVAAGLGPGERVDLSKAGFRWRCEQCHFTTTTRWDDGPRVYPFLPFRGEHRSRVALRRALMRRRNQAESLNARLKGRGISNGGMNVPRWVRTDREVKWLCHGVSLAFTLQRLAHLTGEYDTAREEAERLGLLTPPSGPPGQPPEAS